ncbi:Hydrolase [Gossypium arboreum]|uniref:Hydrolase n=1 Tax=Gossypium arboreum TaxID=29729 RepID=A0A0B0NPM0_GOSAR|nr:Hydrolase [Gossypium arboreum]
MYEIREWKMDHSKLLCNHVPKQHTCYSRILKSHPSLDCNFREFDVRYSRDDVLGYPIHRHPGWGISHSRDIPV